MDIRIMCCSACEGDGRKISGDYDDHDYGRCIVCGGSGEEEIEVRPITMEDLDAPA